MDSTNNDKHRSGLAPYIIIGSGIVVGVVAGAFLRGPCYGVAMGIFVGALASIILLLVLRLLKVSRFRIGGGTLAAILILVIGYIILSPPSAETILHRYLGLDELRGIENLQAFHAYGRDPAFGVKCRVTDDALKRIVARIGVTEDAEPRPLNEDPFFYSSSDGFPVPDWWHPEKISSSRTWTLINENIVPWIALRYDPESRDSYLVIWWH